MSVNLVDPNLLNTNQGFVNGIPQYQDMFIFAELTARSRGRTVLETNNTGQYSISKNGSQDEININFIGNNQNKSATDPNYLKFTTNWYDGSAAEGFRYEGFGISSIKIVINSSFVPQVNIQFIDVRGLAFFNQTDSPYRVLFNFPPSLFTLTIKGYYGMPLEYELHLVKYTSEFKAENGNFIIDAQFIARTFAPLTDVLFRYVVNFPLIPNQNNEPVSLSPAPDRPPKSTYELILKLKNLYAATSDKQNSGIDTTGYDLASNRISAIDTILTTIGAYKANPMLSLNKPIAAIGVKNTGTGNEVVPVTSISSQYGNVISGFEVNGYPEIIPERLLIGYFIYPDVYTGKERVSNTGELINSPSSSFLSTSNPTQEKLDALNLYRQMLLDLANPKGSGSDISGVITESDIIKADSWTTTSGTYVFIDITNYYIKLYKERNIQTEFKVAELNRINIIVNKMILNTLGMKPTIYNIFKIILDDVDTFFRILRDTSRAAETQHNSAEVFSRITGSNLYKDTEKHIFAFPLVIRQTPECGGYVETRIIPKELSTPENPFPEITLVQDFVNTFILQRNFTEQIDMRNNENAEGVNVWLPLSPFDSNLGTTIRYSPYFNVDSSSSEQPVATSQYNKLTQCLMVMLKRFYILSQNSFPYTFYRGEKGTNSYIGLFAQSEAINMAISLFNPTLIRLMLDFAQTHKTPTSFYNYVMQYIPNLYSFPEKQYEFFSLTNGAELPTGRTEYIPGDAYADKENPLYHGFIFSEKNIIFRPPIEVTDETRKNLKKNQETIKDPIERFQISFSTPWWKSIFPKFDIGKTLKFSEENVIFIPDTSSDGVETKTRFIGNIDSMKVTNGNTIDLISPLSTVVSSNKVAVINEINKDDNGNNYFNIKSLNNGYLTFNDIVEIWSYTLGYNDEKIYDTIIDSTNKGGKGIYNPELSQIVLASSFGYALSTFNIFPNELNKLIFSLPAAITIPAFIYFYMGSLVAVGDGTTKGEKLYKDLYDFFVSGPGKDIDSGGVLIFADIVDIRMQLAKADRELFKEWHDDLYIKDTTFRRIVSNLSNLYDEVNKKTAHLQEKLKSKTPSIYYNARVEAYKELLKDGGDSAYFGFIIDPLIEKKCIVNYSEMTFGRDVEPVPLYKSLEETSKTSQVDYNNSYFTQFFGFLKPILEKRLIELNDQKNEDDKTVGDEDIITQTYYSFKNINDKWLSSPKYVNTNFAYPSNGATPAPLINSFAFVDRAMNPVGNTIINPEIIIQLFDDPNVSVFSVLSQLLSLNGFEFFPLQNFMNISGSTWEDSFRIDTVGDVKPRPAFVCMYIGGGSSYPTGIESFGGQFKDDGITEISDVGQFNFDECNEFNELDDNQEETNKDFPWGQVNAFKVKFGEQNQSMFTDVKIDSKEYPETNESIQILSRIAGDNKKQAPPPKGQNLYNLYENRAYKATISGLGNAMIQPTQYFQLENVPLFNGAYIILSVEHNIEPNKMTTNFSGTKILRYPIPRVLESSTILGFDGGNTTETNPAGLSNETITQGPNASAGKSQAQFNSMYEFKVK